MAEKLNRILAIKLARRLREVGTKKPGPPPSCSDAGAASQAAGATSPSLKDSKSKKSKGEAAASENTPASTEGDDKLRFASVFFWAFFFGLFLGFFFFFF